MKKLLYILPVSLLFITGCAKTDKIDGTLSDKNDDGKTVYLYQSLSMDKPFEKIDSTTIENGKFAFNGEYATDGGPHIAYLSIKDSKFPEVPFVNEKGSIKVKIDTLNSISGTPLNDAYQKFKEEMHPLDKQMYDLSLSANPDIEKMKAVRTKQTDIVYSFLKSNIKNVLGEFLFFNYGALLSIDQAKEIAQGANPALKEKLAPLLDNVQKQDGFVGKQYINVTGDTPEGKKISLSDYVGKNKLVLVDFWASWCPPCVKEMPNIADAYNKYKSKGFEIVGVSLDEKKGDWTAALTKLKMTWPQMSDLKGWESKLSAAYGVESIPFTILIDKDGNIIAQNLHGDELDSKLAEILK